jgi:hypothetical protein
MFVCGVHGKGKSHTASCILEDSLARSKHLGNLRTLFSVLIFSFAQFSDNGEGFSISEAAFLASPDSRLPEGVHVKRVHMLGLPADFLRL